MATSALLPTGGIALRGAPDSDIGSRIAKPTAIQAMHVEMTQDIVDELLESIRSGQPPQIIFGRNPQLHYAGKTHSLQTSSENGRHELYSSGTADDDQDDLDFSSLINHSLVVEKAEAVTGAVDTALEQLKSSMAAISELKQANKTIVANTHAHRRVPSKGFAHHLAPSAVGSPLLSVPNSPMAKKPPTSQPNSAHDAIVTALRVPLIHLLAVQPLKESSLADTCRTSAAVIRDLLPKIAKRSADDAEKWQLTDKSFREFNPYKFPYKNPDDREQAINSAIKSFDRLRLTKDDQLWQVLLPREERGQGKCLSRLSVKAPEPKAAKSSTPLHKMPKLNDKKPAAKKTDTEKKVRETKEVEPKPKKPLKEKVVKEKVVKQLKQLPPPPKDEPAKPPKVPAPEPTNRFTPSETKPRARKPAATTENGPSPRVKPKMSARELQRERAIRPAKSMAVSTKPKNPSPLSASPPLNASDFEDHHPVQKTATNTPSGNSDRSLKRKANDIDSDIHNHAKKPHTPAHTNGRLNGSTPSTNGSIKRKSDESSTSTPSNKVRKVANINTTLASRYPSNQHSQISPSDSSSSQTSPSVPSLSFRQTVELSQKFQKYYKRYEDLYWQLTESETPPTESQRNELLKMHKKLEEMKREIKAGAGGHHR